MKSGAYTCLTVIFLLALLLSDHPISASASSHYVHMAGNSPVCDWEAPRNMLFSEVTPTTVAVSWDHPEQGIAPGGYQVRVILTATGQIVHTRKVPGLSYTIPNLQTGTEYTIELRSICTGGEVSNQLINGNVITVYVDEIINTDCPETSDTYTPLGTFYSGTFNNNNIEDDITALPFAADGTNNRIYYWYFRNNNSSKFARCIIEMDRPDGYDYHYHYKYISNNSGWISYLDDTLKVVKVRTTGGTIIAEISFSNNEFTVSKKNTVNFALKIDATCICNSNSPNPFCLSGTALADDNDTQNKEIETGEVLTDKEQGFDDIFLIYPNPAGDKLVVNIQKNTNTTISIIDINGNKRLERKVSELDNIGVTSVSFDVHDLKPGIYIISCVSENSQYYEKFIKL